MNEAAWLKGDSLHLMLEHVRAKHSAARTRVGRRRLRLFCCACVRRIWHLIDEAGRALVEAAERAADELLSREEWRLPPPADAGKPAARDNRLHPARLRFTQPHRDTAFTRSRLRGVKGGIVRKLPGNRTLRHT
jgi:hypothetical protein